MLFPFLKGIGGQVYKLLTQKEGELLNVCLKAVWCPYSTSSGGGWFIHLQKIYVGKSTRVQVYVHCGGHVPQIPSAVLEVELFGSNSIHGLSMFL